MLRNNSTYVHTHIKLLLPSHIHKHTHTNTHTRTYKNAHAHTHARTCTHTCVLLPGDMGVLGLLRSQM